ncbi:MAG: type II secretion system F family protein [Actinomycetota bacterium]|nr:type II secretion system F family protein [Actinomycetota bacterium]
MRRALAFVAGLAAVLTVVAGSAGAASPKVRIAQVDTTRYPLITAVVIAPGSNKLSSVPLKVREGGKAVTATQTGGGAPAAIGVAIDVSRSMEGAPLVAAKKAAASFVKAKRPADTMSIYSFGHEANPVHGLDTDVNALGSSMNQVTLDTVQGTALYDSVIQASSEIGNAPTLTKVLVVLTDGDDTTNVKLGAAVKAAKAGNVTIDAIAIGRGNHAALTSLTKQTGGHVFASDRTAAGIAAVYRQIASEIRNTYRLQYNSHADGLVPLEVSLKGYTSATRQIDLTAPAAQIVAAGGTIAKFSNKSSAGLGLALVIGLLVLAVVLLLVRVPRETVLARRLDRYTTGERVVLEERERGLSLRNLLILRGERSFGGSSYFKKVAVLLERADMPMRAAEFVAIQAGAFLILLLIALVFGLGILYALILGVVGGLVPQFLVRRRANARRKRFEDQLGDALSAVASSLRAGQSFQQAMSTIAMDGPDPMAKEFQRVETETRLGRPADEALQSMADRLASKNFEFVVLAVNIQRQVGGSLSEILDMVSDTVRGRVQFARKVRALTSMGRASAYVLVGMPFFLAGIIFLLDRSYIRPLWANSTGHIMVLVGLISMAMGALVCRKIVNFKY